MNVKIHIGPYVRGPSASSETVQPKNEHTIDRSKSIRAAFANLLRHRLFRRAVGRVLETLKPKKPALTDAASAPVTTRWAFRATNFRQLQHAGWIGSTAGTAAGISSHLNLEAVEPDRLNPGDVICVEARQLIPVDGLILDGMAVVDESPVTGQSSPVIRNAEGVKTVMGQTRVLEGCVFVEVSPRRGHPLDWIGGIAPAAPRNVEPAGR